MGIKFWVASAAFAVLALAGAAWAKDEAALAPAWAHEGSDLTPDPAVTFGKLANGMRYAIRRNQSPAAAVTITLRIAAGSLHETDEQRGLAHFLEHMAFQGSTNVPRGEFLRITERLGAKLGRDTNAFTGFDDTFYTLDLARAEEASVDTALMLFREIADRLLLTQEAMDIERGVVIEEVKERSQPATLAFRAKLAAMLPGYRHHVRWVGGERSVLEKAPVSQIRKFYEQYYRPERGVIVVVGDVDPAAIESKIAAKFADWKQPGRAGKDPDVGRFKPGDLRGEIYTDAALLEAVSISRVDPKAPPAPTKAAYISDFRRDLAVALVKQQVPAASLQLTVTTPRFLDIGSFGKWRSTLRVLEQLTRRLTTFGPNQSDFTRAIDEARAAGEEAIADVQGRTNRSIADRLLDSIRYNRVFLSAEQHVALREGVLSAFTIADANASVRELAGQPTLVFAQSPEAIEGGGGALVKAYRDSETATVEPAPVTATVAFPYTSFGTPSGVAGRRDLAEFGAKEIEFKNRVRLNVKTTDFQKNRVLVGVRFPGGLLDFAKDKTVLRTAYTDGFIRGGLKQASFSTLRDAAANRTYNVLPVLGDDAYLFFGVTNAKDLLFQLQVLAAYVSDAAYSASGLENVKQQYRDAYKRRRTNAVAALRFEQSAVLTSNDQRYVAPNLEVTNAATMDEVKAKLEPMFRSRPLDITIVGDVDAAAAEDAVANTFGALPKRDRRYEPPSGSRDVRFPNARQQLVLRHDGAADSAVAFAAWPGPDRMGKLRQDRTFDLLTEVVASQLFDRLRGAGKAYAPAANNFASNAFPGFGFLQVAAETSPADIDLVYREIDAAIAAIRAGDVSDDAILRARAPRLAGLEAERRTNPYWLFELIDNQAIKRSGAEVSAVVSDYQNISKDEIIAAARTYLDEARRVEIRVVPTAQVISMYDAPDQSFLLESLERPTPGQLPITARTLKFEPAPLNPIREAVCLADPVGCLPHLHPRAPLR